MKTRSAYKKMKAHKFVLKHHFSGDPKDEDFDLVEEELPQELKEDGSWMCL